MLDTCRSTVRSLTTSSAAMALFVCPAATRRKTSSSRRVSPCRGRDGAGRVGPSRWARSTTAPSRSNASRAASNSSAAASSSPSVRHASPTSSRTRATSYGASSSCHRCHERRSATSAAGASPPASSTAPLASAASASSMALEWRPAISSSSPQALRAVAASPEASMTSTQAGSSRPRSNGSLVSTSARRIAATAASLLPCARRSSARPGCGWKPSPLASR